MTARPCGLAVGHRLRIHVPSVLYNLVTSVPTSTLQVLSGADPVLSPGNTSRLWGKSESQEGIVYLAFQLCETGFFFPFPFYPLFLWGLDLTYSQGTNIKCLYLRPHPLEAWGGNPCTSGVKEEQRSGDQGCSPALANPAGSFGVRLASQTCPFLYHLFIVCRPPLAWVRVQFFWEVSVTLKWLGDGIWVGN